MSAIAEERQKFIGGSDISGILGLSRWKTPLSVWAEKTGAIIPKDKDTLQTKLGIRLEEVIAELFTEKTGLAVQRANERRVHPKYPMFAAQIDRLVIGTDDLLECKSASSWKAKEWADDEIPAEYICQVMWQLACSGRACGHIAALIGNQDFIVKIIERDPVMISEMLKRALSFWNDFVLTNIMPMQIGAGDTETLKALFPTAELGKELDLGDQAAKLLELRASSYQDLIGLEKQIEGLENQIRALMGDAESAIAGKYKVSWKNQTRKGYTKIMPEWKGRIFKITEAKEK
jgi:putative phage-type endonuclease